MRRKLPLFVTIILCGVVAALAGYSGADWITADLPIDNPGGTSGIHLKSVSVSRLMASQEEDWHDAPARRFVLNAAPGDLIISVSVQFSAETTAYPGSYLQYNLKLSGDNLGDIYLTRGSTVSDETSTQWTRIEYALGGGSLGSWFHQLGACTSAPLLIRDEHTTVQLRLRNYDEITKVQDSVINILYLKKDSFTIDLNTPQDEP